MAWLSDGALASESSAGNIAVLYPEIGEPYRSIFVAILQGIEDQSRGHVINVPVVDGSALADLTADLHRKGVKAVIALGRAGLNLAAQLKGQWPVVMGCVLSLPEAHLGMGPALSLAPDPALLFARLKVLLPSVRRIWVVYDPRQNDWLIRLAGEAARSLGLELVAREAQDLRAAVRQYREVFQQSDPRRDALWLPQDSSTVDEAVVLPMVLEESWGRGLAVFSSSMAHVRRGALFAMYPDNTGMGRQLVRMVQPYLSGEAPVASGMAPLRDLLLAVNTRTAHHLGLDLDARRLHVDMIFPEP